MGGECLSFVAAHLCQGAEASLGALPCCHESGERKPYDQKKSFG